MNNTKVSFDYEGCYTEHKEFFDLLAALLQTNGHKVGIITGLREKDPFTGEDLRQKMLSNLGFAPDFVHMWGATETITSSGAWKVQKLQDEQVNVHFDDDATEVKKFTAGQIIKTFNSHDPKKF